MYDNKATAIDLFHIRPQKEKNSNDTSSFSLGFTMYG